MPLVLGSGTEGRFCRRSATAMSVDEVDGQRRCLEPYSRRLVTASALDSLSGSLLWRALQALHWYSVRYAFVVVEVQDGATANT